MSRRHIGWTLALALSAATHLALAWFLAHQTKPPPSGGIAVPIEIEIVQAPPPPPPAKSAVSTPSTLSTPSTPSTRSTPPRRAARPAAAPAQPSALAAAQPQPEEAPAVSAASSAPTSDLPRAAPALDLEAKPSFRDGLAVAPPAEPRTLAAAVTPEDKKPQQLIAENEGRRRVDIGMVDPYFIQLGKALIDSWKAEEHVTASGLKGLLAQTEENNRLYLSAWQKNAKRYASGGSPLDHDALEPTVVERTGGSKSLAASDAYDRQLKEQYHSKKRALIRVVQGRNGVLRSVTLLEGSTDPAIDRAAIADVRAAASKIPPPPQEGLGIKEPIVSVWEFELIISISPPVPTISFEFDEALSFLDLRVPLDRRVYKKVKLISVE
jgi:TonB family protein